MRITEGAEWSDLRFLDPWFCVVLTPGFMWKQAGLGGSLGCTSNWWSGGRGFDSRRVRQHYFVKIEHETFFTAILSISLILERQLSVSGERKMHNTG